MNIFIKTFGSITEFFPDTAIELENTIRVEELRAVLEKKYPALNHIHYNVAINKKMTDGDTRIQANDEVALMPPFSGG